MDSEVKLNQRMWLCCWLQKKIKVALATTHIPLADVAKSIKKAKLVETIKIVNAALKKKLSN